MKRLAHLSGVPKVYALAWANGALERLWHYTAKYAIRGDIGRITNREIAEVCCYPIKRADSLIEILIESGWLDRHPNYRLVVHDWADHADESTRKTVRNRGLNFIQNLATTDEMWPKTQNIFGKSKIDPSTAHNKIKDLQADFLETFENDSSLPLHSIASSVVEKEETVHTHTNGTLGARAKTSPTTNGTRTAIGLPLKRLDEFLAHYPDKSDPEATARAYAQFVTAATEDTCHACLARYNASDRVARNVVQRGRNWLEQQSRNGFHGQWEPPPTAVKRKTASFEESVRKVLAERVAKGGKPW